jgi:hypothetical protein
LLEIAGTYLRRDSSFFYAPETILSLIPDRRLSMRTFWILLVFALVFALGGCSPSQIGTGDSRNPPLLVPQETPTQAPLSTISPVLPIQGENTPMAPALPTPYSTDVQSLIETAKADLVKRFSIPAAGISAAEVFEVTWPDSGLGCSQTGMESAQVMTPGYLILLEYNNNKYEYHANKGTYVTYCMNPAPLNLGVPNQ